MIDAEYVVSFFEKFIPSDYREYVMTKLTIMKTKVNHWVKGQVTLMFVIGVGFYIGLWLIHIFVGPVQYKETISVVAGILEVVPFIGPILTALFALLIAVNQGFGVFLSVLILSVLIQNLENNFIVPVVMKKAVGVSSLVIFICLLIGATFYGVLGIFLAVPVVAILSVFFEDLWMDGKKK